MNYSQIIHVPLCDIVSKYPVISDFFESYNINPFKNTRSFSEEIQLFDTNFWEEHGFSCNEFTSMFIDFVISILQLSENEKIQTLEIIGGFDKDGNKENCNLLLVPGEITCIIGPTGSGKSRLLADIEWLADKDTPSKRIVKINGEIPDDDFKQRYSGKLISQITQNMNFVLDIDVGNFLLMHARSRYWDDPESKVAEVIVLANELSGEKFDNQTPVTFLSGGQSRALMIADVACIGQAPIILIDEIENAGIDKKKAFELLVSKDKIVLMATHDPLLILQADKRVIIRNGAMQMIVKTSEKEKKYCSDLARIDALRISLREKLRNGVPLDTQPLRFKPEFLS